MKILVVDDEADLELLIRQKFRKQVQSGAYTFFFAHNGVEALEHLKNHHDIEVVLTDINMPEMDGLTLLVKIGELDRVLRAVVVSAYGDLDNIRTAMNRGAFDFLTKPIDFSDLELTVEKTIKQVTQLRQAVHEHARLESIQHELELARTMQQSILPQIFPAFPDRHEFDLFATMIPARMVGGDFYDFFLVDHDHLGLVIADVADKGIPAALFMMMSRTLLRARALNNLPPAQCLQEVNTMLCDNNDAAMFVTLFYGVLDIARGVFRYANGGHNPPCLVRATGAITPLQTQAGPVLGVLEGAAYEEQSVTLQPHDAIFFYTDGVTEAEADGQGFFTETRLSDTLRQCSGASAQTIVTTVVGAVQQFAGSSPQSDDITALAMRYLPEAGAA